MELATAVIDFFVPGIPVQQGSKNAFVTRNKEGEVTGANVVESASKMLKPWRADVKVFADDELHEYNGGRIFVGPIQVRLQFVMRRPKGTPKSKPTPPAVKKPDLDKLIRAALDALKGTVYGDDSQVVSVEATKRIAEEAEQTGLRVTIGEMHDYPHR